MKIIHVVSRHNYGEKTVRKKQWWCVCVGSGVRSSSGAAEGGSDPYSGGGKEENSEWRNQTESSGEKQWGPEVVHFMWTREHYWGCRRHYDNPDVVYRCVVCVLMGVCLSQRAQYQDKLARQRYEDQLRQQVRSRTHTQSMAFSTPWHSHDGSFYMKKYWLLSLSKL